MIEKLHFIDTIKYGTVVVSNTQAYEIYDEDGNHDPKQDMPAGMVCRWLPKGQTEPEFKIIKDVFTKDFANDAEIRKYLEDNNLLDDPNY